MSEQNAELEKVFFDKYGIRLPKMYGALELANMEFPPQKWIVEGVMSPGVTHFAGKERVDK